MLKELIKGSFIVGTVAVATLALVEVLLEEELKPKLKPKKKTKLEVGDLVQWECRGAFMFKEPKKIISITSYKDEQFVLVEDVSTGIPINQIIKIG